MIKVNTNRTEHETLAKVLKAEIRNKMEQIDALKLSILKNEYDLYKMYSRLDDLDAKAAPEYMEKSIKRSDVNEKSRKIAGFAMQAG